MSDSWQGLNMTKVSHYNRSYELWKAGNRKAQEPSHNLSHDWNCCCLQCKHTKRQIVHIHTNCLTQRIRILQDGCKIFFLDFWEALDIVFCLKRNMDIKLDFRLFCNVTTLSICLVGNSTRP